MKAHFSDKPLKYDGSQLHSLFAYKTFGVQGDSIVSFAGGCDIPFEHMVDGEDFVAQSPIRGDHMLHFIVEKFHLQLTGAVALQRLLTCIAIEVLGSMTSQKFVREGDDIYVDGKKLSISVATVSPTSALIHFALNINNKNTPVKTCSLGDLNIQPEKLAKKLIDTFCSEVRGIDEAACKVRPVN